MVGKAGKTDECIENEYDMGLETPVALIIFRRPDQTRKVLKMIAEARPRVLYVISDGPSTGDSETAAAVAECKSLIEEIDWDCKVRKNYSDVNLGCRARVVSGLDWVFENETSAIILEDDCVPDQSFFGYCEFLLKRYENEDRIGGIGGTNIYESRLESLNEDFFFSRYPAIWGWATWKRTWIQYRKLLPEVKLDDMKKFSSFSTNSKTHEYWLSRFKEVRDGRLDTWDYQLSYTCMENDKLWVIPTRNLIRNIGFGRSASHTLDADSPFAELGTSSISLPLTEPGQVNPREEYDDILREEMHANKLWNSVAMGIYKLLPRWFQESIKTMFTKLRFPVLRK